MMIRAIIACLLPLATTAQMLNTERPLDLEEWVSFDPDFMRQNDIDSVEIRLQTKRSGGRIREWNDVTRLGFDTEGRLSELFSTRAAGPITDTTHWLFEFGEFDHWIRKQEKDATGYYIFEPEIDEAERITEMHCYKAPAPQTLSASPQTQRTRINSETFRYWNEPGKEFCRSLNHYDLPYELTTTERDSLGYVCRIRHEFLVTRRVKETRCAYNEAGQLAEATFSHSHKPDTETHRYTYDRAGNLTQVALLKNDQLHLTYEVVYDGLGRIDGIIIVQPADQSMRILNFSYPE